MRNRPIKFLAPLAGLLFTTNLFSMGQYDQFLQQNDQCEKPRIPNPPQCDTICDGVQVKYWLCVNGKTTIHFKTAYDWLIKKSQKNGEEFDIPTKGKIPAEKKDCPEWTDNSQCGQNQQGGHSQYYDLGLQTWSNLESQTKVVERSRVEDATAHFEFVRSACEPYSYEIDTQEKCLGQCDTAQREQWAVQCPFGSEIEFMNEVIESYKNEAFDWDTQMSEQVMQKAASSFASDMGFMMDSAKSDCSKEANFEQCEKSSKSFDDVRDFDVQFDGDQGQIEITPVEEPKKSKKAPKVAKKSKY